MGRACTPKESSEFCFFPKQTIHSALKSLEGQGYVTLSVSEKNRKNKLISLTTKGDEFMRKIIYPIVDAEKAALNELTLDERKEMLFLFSKYQKFLREKIGVIFSGKSD